MTIHQQVLDKAALEAYRSRWEAVAHVEAAERQQASMSQRLQQLNSLFQLAIALQIYKKAAEHNGRDAQVARERWIQLKAKLT